MADSFLALLEKEKPTIQQMLPSNEDRDRWWALAYEMSRRAELREVAEKNPFSLLNAIKKFADWGLIPDGEEGFINVYNIKQRDGSYLPEASPEAMYKGWIRRAIDAGVIMHAVADVLREGDTIEESIETRGRVLKVNRQHGKAGRKYIGAYALFWLPNGLMDYELFESEDIDAVKKAALRNAQRRKSDAGLSPAWQFFEGEQIKKSILKRGLKRMRGKRDTDAGRRFSEMINTAQFDAETTASEIPDNLLSTHLENGGGETATAAGATENKLPPSMPTPAARLITAEERRDLAFAAEEKGVDLRQLIIDTTDGKKTASKELDIAEMALVMNAINEA